MTNQPMRGDDTGRPHASSLVSGGATFGIGSLPHRSAGDAARFAIDAFEIPTVASLPRRSPHESAVAQALIGVGGVSLGPYGTIAVDCDRLDPSAPVRTDLAGDGFTGLRAVVDLLARDDRVAPLKWQFLGPISVGLALIRAGAEPSVAFAVAHRAVRSHTASIEAYLFERLANRSHIVVLDEPFADGMLDAGFPLAPDEAIDLISGALAGFDASSMVGVHSCTGADVASLVQAGPHLLSVPVDAIGPEHAGYVDRFLAAGGWIAWGAVTTSGPIGVGQPRAWQRLAERFCELVQLGCDAERLQQQSFLTPSCGLGHHATATADRVVEALRETSLSMRSQASAARFVLGA